MTTTAPNPCGPCGACCKSYIVPVCGYDIWLISTLQHLSPEQFLIACPQEEQGRDGFLLEAGQNAFGLALDKQGKFEPKARCVFLLHLADGQDRCGVYAARPVICQGYPMAIWNNMMYLRKDVLCPPDSWPREAPRNPHWRAAYQRIYMHYDIYHEAVARWNARVDANPGERFALLEYFSYLMNVYDALDRLARETGEEKLAAIQASWPGIPRPARKLDEIRVRQGDLPWLDYFLTARQIIDGFYPEIAPTPLIALLPSR